MVHGKENYFKLYNLKSTHMLNNNSEMMSTQNALSNHN